MRLIFATGNAGKLREIKQILSDLSMEIVSMKEAGILTDIVEDGQTFEENALIKARTVASMVKDGDTLVLADDSGLEVDALMGEPGIYSARFLGEDTPYSKKNVEIIKRLEGVPDEKRTARFRCAIAAVLPDGTELTSCCSFEGKIGYEPRGEGGFGYDPIFYLPDMSRSSAELRADEKNALSHRGKALRDMKRKLEKIQIQ